MVPAKEGEQIINLDIMVGESIYCFPKQYRKHSHTDCTVILQTIYVTIVSLTLDQECKLYGMWGKTRPAREFKPLKLKILNKMLFPNRPLGARFQEKKIRTEKEAQLRHAD